MTLDFVGESTRNKGPRLVLAAFALLGAARAHACGPAALRAATIASQSEASYAAATIEPLLRCRGEADAAAYWRAYALAASGDALGSRASVPQATTIFSGDAQRVGILTRARSGAFEELLGKIDDSAPGYAISPDAQLVLARSLVRAGRHVRGQRAYVDFLRLRPDDEGVEAEYLFSFLWAGDLAGAASRLAQMERYPLPPELAAAASRARAALARRGVKPTDFRIGEGITTVDGVQPFESLSAIRGDEPRISAAVTTARTVRVYRRDSMRVAYSGPIDLALSLHAFAPETPVAHEQRLSEIGVTGRLGAAPGITADLGLGYLTGDDSTPLGKVRVAFDQGQDGLEIGGGIGRTPLALTLPLAPEDAVAVRDELHATFRWRQLVMLRSSLARDSDGDALLAAHSRHELLMRARLRRTSDPLTFVDARLPVSIESRPRPSPLEDTDRRNTAFGVGLAWSSSLVARGHVHADADYLLQTVETRDNDPGSERYALIDARAGATVRWSDMVETYLVLVLQRSDDDARRLTRDAPSSITLGVTVVP